MHDRSTRCQLAHWLGSVHTHNTRATPSSCSPLSSPTCHELTIVNISSVSWCRAYETFGVYSAGKAARHMLLVATPALEADMFHPPNAGPADTDQGVQGGDGHGNGHKGDGGSARSNGGSAAKGPKVRALSYAPGAIDTDMQAAARESLPRIPLKAAFEGNKAAGRLVDPRDSAAALVRLLARPRGEVGNGSHWDYYDCLASEGEAAASGGSGSGGGGEARHPLDRPPAMAAAAAAVKPRQEQ